MGAWSMVLMLWQQFEYYYYYFISKITHYAVFPVMHGKTPIDNVIFVKNEYFWNGMC